MEQQKISALLEGHPWQHRVLLLDTVDSTNNLAKDMARQGAPEGTVLIADRQSAGRGRLGRTFFSPPGVGIYFSVILRPNCPPQELMHLTCAAGVAMVQAVERACGFRPDIKWTNDLVVGSRKLGGILTELSVNPKTQLVDFAVVGIGINCRQKEADFDETIRHMACSVEMVLGTEFHRTALAAEMVRAVEEMNRTLLTDRAGILDAYRRSCITLGQEISVVRGINIRHGFARSVDEEGALVVEYEDGTCEAVTSGEVSIRGLYGYV